MISVTWGFMASEIMADHRMALLAALGAVGEAE
jgi:hypothetical protein